MDLTIPELHEMRVQKYGRLLYFVESRSRYNVRHLVDLEGFEIEAYVCTCEAYRYHGYRPCHHVLRVALHLVEEEPELAAAIIDIARKRAKQRTFKLKRNVETTKSSRLDPKARSISEPV